MSFDFVVMLRQTLTPLVMPAEYVGCKLLIILNTALDHHSWTKGEEFYWLVSLVN